MRPRRPGKSADWHGVQEGTLRISAVERVHHGACLLKLGTTDKTKQRSEFFNCETSIFYNPTHRECFDRIMTRNRHQTLAHSNEVI